MSSTTSSLSNDDAVLQTAMIPWSWDRAKLWLTTEIKEGRIKEAMLPKEVYHLREEFQFFKYENFRNNLRKLRNNLAEWSDKAMEDEEDLKKDRMVCPPNNEGRWDGSDAQKWFKIDMKNGLDKTMSLDDFYSSRACYQEFPRCNFRKRIHGYHTSVKGRAYWLNRKEKENEKKEIDKVKKMFKKDKNRKTNTTTTTTNH